VAGQRAATLGTEYLMNVQGIGEKSFLKLKPMLTVTPPKQDAKGGER
jgi:hypothetical protein